MNYVILKKNIAKNRKIFVLAALVFLGCLSFALIINHSSYAANKADQKQSNPKSSDKSSSELTGGGSVKEYDADSDLQYGTVVRLDKKNDKKVMPVAQNGTENMYGVVVDPQLLSVTYHNSDFKHQTYVATSGNYAVLVSNQNGPINQNDYVEASSIAGVTMNAGKEGVTVFGRALDSFDGKNNTLGSTTLKDESGNTIKKVAIGIVPVAINIQRNPKEKSTKVNAPNLLQRVGKQIAKKPITPARLYFSVTIIALSLIIAIVILYSGIRNGMVSLGRNPLSRKTILRGLAEVIIGAVIVLIIGFFAVYLLLRL